MVDRIKSKLASINLISVAFFGLSIFSVAFAWFAYTNVVSTNFDVDVKTWKIRITNDNTEINNSFNFNVNDLYPGMNTYSETFTIQNQGELPAKIDYNIKSLRIFNQTINTDNMTFYELQRDYPFKINFSYNKRYLAPSTSATLSVSCAWDLDSGNDDLDTQYGNMAYEFYQSENTQHQNNPSYQIRPGLELEIEIMVVQYIDEINSFATDSWDTIQIAVERGQTSNYHVGDTKTVTIGNNNYTVRIANMSDNDGICHRGDTSKTACGFVVEFAEITEKKIMNSVETHGTGGFPATELHQYLNDSFFSSLPYNLKKYIATTKVISGHNEIESTNFTSNDKIYLFSPMEIYNTYSQINYYDTANSLTRQLDYYYNNNVSISNNSAAIKILGNDEWAYWLRSVDNILKHFCIVTDSGGRLSWSSDDNFIGIAPAFRIA